MEPVQTLRTIALVASVVELESRRVERADGTEHRLSEREVDILQRLVARRGAPVTKRELQDEVWGQHPNVVSRAVDAAVARLRRKIERDPKDPDHVLTVYSVGYRFAWAPAGPPRPPSAAATTSFVGREDDVEWLTSGLVRDGGVWTVTGPPGVGKTRLALEVFARVEGLAKHRSFASVSLHGVASEADLAVALAAALELSPSGTGTPLDAILDRLSDAGPIALLLNDADEVPVASLARIAAALHRRATLLFSARVPLGVSGERVHRLTPLPLSDATTLYHQRALARGVRATHLDTEGVLRLVDHLDGLPLLIELAAAKAATLAPEALLQLLKREPAGEDDPLGSHAIRAAWRLLDADERDAAQALAVISVPFSLDAAISLLGEPDGIRRLEALVRSSWVQVEATADGHRYRMLGPLRAHVRNQPGFHVDARVEALARYLRDHTQPVSASGTNSLRVLNTWLPDLVRCASLPDPDLALPCLHALRQPMLELGQGGRLRTLANAARHRWTQGEPAWVAATLLAAVGAASAGEGRAAASLWAEVDLAAVGDSGLRARVLVEGAAILRATGDFRAALPLAREAALLLDSGADPALAARAHRNCALLHSYMGDVSAALEHAEQAVRAVRAGGPSSELGYCLLYKGQVLGRMGEPHRAEVCHRRALALARELEARTLERAALGSVASMVHEQGRQQEAQQLWQQALDLNRAVGDVSATLVTHINLGNLHQERGALEAAHAHYAWAAELASETDQPHRMAAVRLNLGSTLHRQSKLARALASYRASRDLARAAGRVRLEAYAETLLALGLLQRGDRAACLAALTRASSAAQPLEDGALLSMVEVVRDLGQEAVDDASLGKARARLAEVDGTGPRALRALLETW